MSIPNGENFSQIAKISESVCVKRFQGQHTSALLLHGWLLWVPLLHNAFLLWLLETWNWDRPLQVYSSWVSFDQWLKANIFALPTVSVLLLNTPAKSLFHSEFVGAIVHCCQKHFCREHVFQKRLDCFLNACQTWTHFTKYNDGLFLSLLDEGKSAPVHFIHKNLLEPCWFYFK